MQMVELFGKVRDEWIEQDLAGWLAPNRVYDGVAEPIRAAMASDEVYIVTTKQVRCVGSPVTGSAMVVHYASSATLRLRLIQRCKL